MVLCFNSIKSMRLYKEYICIRKIKYVQVHVQHIYQCFSMFCQQGAAPHPEEELDRLTKKLVYDMNHPPTEEYFGMLQHFTSSVLYFCFYIIYVFQ